MRRYTKPLTHCPNCDACFLVAIWLGEEWNCPSCSEYGTHRAGGYSDAPLVPIFQEQLTPRQAEILEEFIGATKYEPTRFWRAEEVFSARNNIDSAKRRILRVLAEKGVLEKEGRFNAYRLTGISKAIQDQPAESCLDDDDGLPF